MEPISSLPLRCSRAAANSGSLRAGVPRAHLSRHAAGRRPLLRRRRTLRHLHRPRQDPAAGKKIRFKIGGEDGLFLFEVGGVGLQGKVLSSAQSTSLPSPVPLISRILRRCDIRLHKCDVCLRFPREMQCQRHNVTPPHFIKTKVPTCRKRRRRSCVIWRARGQTESRSTPSL